ncbi:hypothetical protein [Natrinema versiforme]|uniref:Helix-turn-helix domain-containing protein n=1 Tax=Natrinema versiforme TaxID=88724 RepID=A0A4V1FY22_9EURY|nr:hypothetical protein [Natrinema versiforme]QCS41173.1 hypothetical protein FEJ81_01970 [Natrinema versiforme]
MRMSTAVTLALTVLLATTTLGAVAATPSAQSSAAVDSSSATSPALQSHALSSASTAPPPPDQPDTWQVIRIRVTDTGDAEWTIESRFRVTNETEAETFNDFADAVVSDQNQYDYGFDPANYVSRSAESTGREMSVENAGWDDPRIEDVETDDAQAPDGEPGRVGVLSYSFTWTNFGTVDGDRIHVDDTFQTSDGLLLPTLSAGQRLVIEPPSNYGFVNAPTGTQNGALVWNGPYEFETNNLQITILRGAGSNSSIFSGQGWLIAAVLALMIVVSGTVYLLTQRDLDVPILADQLSSLEFATVLERGPAEDDRGSTRVDANGGTESVTSPAPEPSTSDSAGSGTRLEFEEPGDDDIDPELLSDEERVLRLLKQNGGRMKQASIVSETGWSNAKVSQLLSKMDDDDEIEKLRIGRENLITLPGVDPTELD